MSRSKETRARIVETNSPLGAHSLNQKNIKQLLDGHNRLEPSKKVSASKRRIQKHEADKIERITRSVLRSFNGHDGINLQILSSEIRHLKNHGIPMEMVLAKELDTSENILSNSEISE